jgi:hypothetical protein
MIVAIRADPIIASNWLSGWWKNRRYSLEQRFTSAINLFLDGRCHAGRLFAIDSPLRRKKASAAPAIRKK